jgi:hypothetical protein
MARPIARLARDPPPEKTDSAVAMPMPWEIGPDTITSGRQPWGGALHAAQVEARLAHRFERDRRHGTPLARLPLGAAR